MLPLLGTAPSLPAELRQLVEAVFVQESERVRVAVLQHLIDDCRIILSAAPYSISECCQGWDVLGCWANAVCVSCATAWHHPQIEAGAHSIILFGADSRHPWERRKDMPAKQLGLPWPALSIFCGVPSPLPQSPC